jgi:hypothetical protein
MIRVGPVLTSGQGLCGFREVLVRLSQVVANGQCIALDDLMDDMEEIRHAQTLQPLFGELDQGVGAITDEGEHPGAEGLEPLLHQRLPRGIRALLRHLF